MKARILLVIFHIPHQIFNTITMKDSLEQLGQLAKFNVETVQLPDLTYFRVKSEKTRL